jgi:hypothetical protein
MGPMKLETIYKYSILWEALYVDGPVSVYKQMVGVSNI